MGSIVNGIQRGKAAAAAADVQPGKSQLSPLMPLAGQFSQFGSNVSQCADTGRRTRSRPKRKDPNAPKKPRSAYVFFMEKERKVVKEEDATLRPNHIMKVVGEKWAKMSTEEKEEYEDMAKADRARYLEAMKEYTPPTTPPDEPGAKRAKKDDGPKKPSTAFMLFSKELRHKLGREMNSAEKTKKIAETWREMTDEEKQTYQTAAKEDKQRYERELTEMEAEAQEQQKQQQAVSSVLFCICFTMGF